jgi:hypothetical protein
MAWLYLFALWLNCLAVLLLNMPFLRTWFSTIGWDIQPRHQPIENIRSRQLVSYPFILLSMVWPINYFYILYYLYIHVQQQYNISNFVCGNTMYILFYYCNNKYTCMVFPYTNQNYIMPSPCKTTIKNLIIILTVYIAPLALLVTHICIIFAGLPPE